MKKLLTKSILLLAGLLTGSSAWAQLTEVTYDFSKMENLSIEKSGKAWKPTGSFEYLYVTNSDLLKYFFAFTTAGAPQIKSGNLTNTSENAAQMALCNLKAGDKVTFTFTTGTNGGLSFRVHSTAIAFLDEDEKKKDYVSITSGETYTATADGYMAVQIAKTTTYISKITIATSNTETVPPPTIKVAANGVNRLVSVVPNVSSISSAVTAYYTTDGSTPTSSSTKYTAPFTVTENTTVKAISISNSSAATASEVSSEDVEAGTAVQLAAPRIVQDLAANGDYFIPTFTFVSDQSGVIGNPTATITYSVDGGDEIAGESYVPAGGCTITVTASADGYTSASASTTVYSALYTKATTLDFSESTYASTTKFSYDTSDKSCGKAYNSANKVDNEVFPLTAPEALVGYLAFQAIAGADDTNAWYIRSEGTGKIGLWTAGNARAAKLLGRTSKQIVAFNCIQDAANVMTYLNKSGAPNGNYTMLKSGDNKTYYATMTADGGIGFCGVKNAGYITSIVIYEPVTAVSSTLSTAGWATLYTPCALNFASATPEGLEAYTASVSGSTVTLTKVDDVQAGTGVVLKGSGEYSIPVATSSITEKGDLKGSTSATTAFDAEAGYTYYVLVKNGDGDAQFNPLAKGSVPVGKAYLRIGDSEETPANLRVVIDGEEATGIDRVGVAAHEDGVMYNVAGQRVNAAYKGIVVKNGKKYLRK